MIKEWKNRVIAFTEANEKWVTIALLVIAAGLILIACFGKTEHKAMAMVYIIL